MGERIFTLEILGNAYELPLIVAALPFGQVMTDQTARILNRLLAKAAAILLIASALILSPIIAAGIELLGKG
jgi:isopentenyl diphosphate isomerase/L-lactate dehydrogenase-like FMN-dependent dehydrogenase